MKTVVYSCAFVPCEWIAAHGLRPKRIRPAATVPDVVGPMAGLCPYTQAFVNAVCADEAADAIIVTTVCDPMRRVPDLLAPRTCALVHVMNVPSTWQSVSARQLYVDELCRLSERLVGLGGKRPHEAELAEVMREYEARRLDLRQATPPAWGCTTARKHQTWPRSGDGVPLAIVGGELLSGDMRIFDLVEQAGGQIVLDATDNGQRTLPAPLDRRRMQSEPLMELARAYFGSIPHAFRRPNGELYRYLKTELAERNIRGMIFRRYPWCDVWNAELPRLRDRAGIPVLDLDVGSQGDDRIRLEGRIQAFMEMLR